MTISSENLYEYINDLAPDEKVKFKVYHIGDYVTQIYWNGESFEWDTGTFTSEAFFSPAYVFEVIEEDKKIEKLYGEPRHNYTENELYIVGKINEIIDILNEMREDK